MRLIDADALKHYILTKGFYCDTEADRQYSAELVDEVFPTIEAEPIKHGRWEKDGEIMMFGDIPVKCSQCGFKTLQDALHRMDYHYCPNCGARCDL